MILRLLISYMPFEPTFMRFAQTYVHENSAAFISIDFRTNNFIDLLSMTQNLE